LRRWRRRWRRCADERGTCEQVGGFERWLEARMGTRERRRMRKRKRKRKRKGEG
jgi:hypothetical protein